MPSAAVRDEGALQMRPAPRGYSSALLCVPISFSLPKKEMGSPAKGKEGCAKPEVHPVPASRQKKAAPFRFRRGGESSHPQPPSSFPNCDRSLGHNLVLENSTAPHAILMMADIWLFTDTLCKGGQGLPPLQRKKSTPSGGSDGVPLFIVLLFVSEAVSGANPCRRRSGRR